MEREAACVVHVALPTLLFLNPPKEVESHPSHLPFKILPGKTDIETYHIFNNTTY